MSSVAESILDGAEITQVEAVEITDEAVLGGSSSATRFVSAWTYDTNASNHNTVFRHGLNAIPTSLMILFSTNLETVSPLIWSWNPGDSGNPVSIRMDNQTITLSIYSSTPLHGWWSGQPAGWTSANSGYWRVIASV